MKRSSRRNKINEGSLVEPSGPHAVVGRALREARLARDMTAAELIAFVGDGSMTPALVSSYEAGRYLPAMDRLSRLLAALGATVTDAVRDHYARVLEDAPHMGQVQPGGRTRTGEAKRIIAAWQRANSAAEAAAALGIDRKTLLVKIANYRNRGVPLKLMRISREEYADLAAYAASFELDKEQD
jgi:transcriptional regulator with XRE-family HTH domain